MGRVLAWLDLEMTGLDPQRHVIVEIATLITDDELNIIAEGPDLVVHATEDQLSLMDPVVVEMHTRSGLLEQIRASQLPLESAAEQTMEFLRQHLQPGTTPLCGNSIGTDRRFLAAHLPEMETFFHYRSIDVSTIKELGKRWFPADVAASPKKVNSHRALDDIRESVNELIYYRSALFKPAQPSVTPAPSS